MSKQITHPAVYFPSNKNFQSMELLLSEFNKNGLRLRNHMVMSPMTRSRAADYLPNALMAAYYAQRSSAGLIITEGTAPSYEGLGYFKTPGIYSQEQIEGWKLTTKAVHDKGGKIFVQLMHTGRINTIRNWPAADKRIHVTEIIQGGQPPVPLSTDGVKELSAAFAQAGKNAVAAGFDGVELHGAHGYLLEQFLNPNINTRTDEYGGNYINRSRFVLETTAATIAAIGKERTGIRLSPFSNINDMPAYAEEEVHNTYVHLAKELNNLGVIYIHISLNANIPAATLTAIREAYTGILIFSNGQTAASAEAILQSKEADLVGFGKSFLANPDLVERFAASAPLNELNKTGIYGGDAEGYTDYPVM